MKVNYTCRKADITDGQKKKLKSKFEKLHKILGAKKTPEAHVYLSRQRHRCDAEVTLHALSHTLVVTASNVDAFTAVAAALEKLGKQVVKNKHKLIETRRPERQRGEPSLATRIAADPAALALGAEPEPRGRAKPRVITGNGIAPKPLTVEEALIQIEELDRDQLTYRDAENGAVRVLARRRDGNFELVEVG
jgi:putative sigma-54 modulation protein